MTGLKWEKLVQSLVPLSRPYRLLATGTDDCNEWLVSEDAADGQYGGWTPGALTTSSSAVPLSAPTAVVPDVRDPPPPWPLRSSPVTLGMDSLMIAPGLETEPGAIRHEADSRKVYLQRLERSTLFAVGFVSLTAANKCRILLFTRKIHILQSS